MGIRRLALERALEALDLDQKGLMLDEVVMNKITVYVELGLGTPQVPISLIFHLSSSLIISLTHLSSGNCREHSRSLADAQNAVDTQKTPHR
jgi:hypothetical protein